MRIIAGEYRSRTLLAPEGFSTRPIPDRVKESVFGMLGARVEGARVVDLFSGSGAIGLEALSRGAASCLFVDQDKSAVGVLRRNVDTLGCGARAQIVQGDALGLSIPARCPRPIDLVFFDPPYPLIEEPTGWQRVRAQAARLAPLLSDDGFIIIRTPQPFMIELPSPAGEAEAERRPRRRRANERGGRRRDEWTGLEASGERAGRGGRGGRRDAGGDGEHLPGPDDELIDPEELAVEGVRVQGDAAPKVEKIAGDLVIEGARGPETHGYGKTAVHWYMKAAAGG